MVKSLFIFLSFFAPVFYFDLKMAPTVSNSKEKKQSTKSTLTIPFSMHRRYIKGLYYKKLFESLNNTPEENVHEHELGR